MSVPYSIRPEAPSPWAGTGEHVAEPADKHVADPSEMSGTQPERGPHRRRPGSEVPVYGLAA